mgnify:CR=1 FL=1
MSIENDIKQLTSFRSPYHRALVNLMYTNNWICAEHSRMLKKYDLTLQQYNVLRILRGQHPKPVRVLDITERMLDKMSNASRLVDKLLTKKLLQRTECPNDRRAVDVVITEKGLELLRKLDDVMDAQDNRFAALSEEEADLLSHLLDKLRGSDD